MVNTKDYSETRKQLQELIIKWGKSNVIKELNTNHKQVQSIIDNKKQFLTQKIIDRINNLYLQAFGDRVQATPLGAFIHVDDIDNTSDEVFKKYLNQAENKITNAYADKEYNQKVMKVTDSDYALGYFIERKSHALSAKCSIRPAGLGLKI
jgi:hypothetical protein